MNRVDKFPLNDKGRDFIVGDIHGCFDVLCEAMDSVTFNPEVDRLFSVGDLVDRGAQSLDSINWLRQPWFHAVRGNHEQMAIGVAEGRHDLGNYLMNGGQWFFLLSDEKQQEVADEFSWMPICIEVETNAGLVGIVHADIKGTNWQEFIEQLENPRSNNHLKDLLEHALWNRDRIRAMDDTGVEGLHMMYVGHTPVKVPLPLGNVRYVDTGAVFGKSLTIEQIN